MDDFITNHFFEIWGICSLIVTIGVFLWNYDDFRTDGFVALSVKDIFWVVVLILLGPITIFTIIIGTVVKFIEDLVYSDFWKKNVIFITKKEKKNEKKNED